MRTLEVERGSLIVLVGASGAGKSYWAHTFFRPTEVVSSDHCRALVSDDEEEQRVNREAFAVFYTIIDQRLSLGRTTVADSTAIEAFARARLRGIAASHGAPVHAVLFRASPDDLLRHDRMRTRRVPEEVLLRHARQVEILAEDGVLETEGFTSVTHLTHPHALAVRPRVLQAQPPRVES